MTVLSVQRSDTLSNTVHATAEGLAFAWGVVQNRRDRPRSDNTTDISHCTIALWPWQFTDALEEPLGAEEAPGIWSV